MVNWPYFTFLAQIVVSQGTFEAPPLGQNAIYGVCFCSHPTQNAYVSVLENIQISKSHISCVVR